MTDEHYHFFGGTNDNDDTQHTEMIEYKIRSGPMICFNGEPDLDKMMKGDFRRFERPDCALKFDWIFRWAWESWRLVVGKRIGQIYPAAVKIMNSGAIGKGLVNFTIFSFY